ncbi:MFS transporter [Cohnella kolymensis]|uniref:MFS transporter n=1 Tax=Cohnella kolymensis TaxID=1590652 RepID=A0ABR5A6G6_9BACL|nr:MFS transporter [Cohnella kolymensis]KIL36591.1 MFS transporter [Cohnella kolymensis]
MHESHKPAHHRGSLDKQTWLLLIVNGLYITANALSGTFLGVYIWKESNNFTVLGWFTLLTNVFMAVTFWIAGNWVKEGNKMICLRIGTAVSAVFYATVLLLGKNAFHYIWLLGIIQGLSIGFFWLSFNVIYFEVTNAGNRDRFNGWTGVMGSVVGMIAPWCSGYLISRLADEKGYRIVFMISLGIFVACVAVSFFLRNRRMEGNYHWLLPFRIMKKRGTPWRPIFGALAAQGLRESVFGVMIGLLVFIHTGSEMQLGNFALITSAVGFVSFYATGRWLKPAWRPPAMLVGTIVMTLVIIPLFFGVNYTNLLIFGIGAALFIPLYTIPMTSAVFDMIGTAEDSVKERVEYVVMRELALNVGRITGMIIFITTVYVSREPLVINCMLLFVGSAPILSWVFMRKRLLPQHR